jgi:hypothetical protein
VFDDKTKELRWKTELLRRFRRRVKLPNMLARLRGRFEYLVASIGLQMQGFTDLANKLHQVEQAAKVLRRYNQLANKAGLPT